MADEDINIKIILVDDHAMIRAGLSALIGQQHDMEVVAQADRADDVMGLVDEWCPDIVIMDLGMPGLSAFNAIRSIAQSCPDVRVIVLTMHKGRHAVANALEAGAEGFVPKSTVHSDLLRAIRAVHQGKRYVHPAAAAVLIEEVRGDEVGRSLLNELSEREIEVLNWTARGYISREIGEEMSISPKTVDTYRQRVMSKLGLNHRSELVRLACQAGLLGDWV